MNYTPEVQQEWIDKLSVDKVWNTLDRWQKDFIIDMERKVKQHRDLTEREEHKLEEIYVAKTD